MLIRKVKHRPTTCEAIYFDGTLECAGDIVKYLVEIGWPAELLVTQKECCIRFCGLNALKGDWIIKLKSNPLIITVLSTEEFYQRYERA